MARKTASDAHVSAQSKIPFALTKSRRSIASDQALSSKAAKLESNGKIIDQPRLRQRRDKQIAQESEPPATPSQQNIEEVINGADSVKLLQKLSQDRIESPRFHQEDLSTADKILRLFDVSSTYGPAQGLTRLQRWNRAHKLGKQPPYQVKVILEATQQSPEYAERYEKSLFGSLGDSEAH